MSQKPYMWNRNNPIIYSDPTGFAPGAGGAVAALEGLAGLAACLAGGCEAAMAAGAGMFIAGTFIAASGGTSVADYTSAARGKSMPVTGGVPNSRVKRGNSVGYYDKNGNLEKRVDIAGRSHGNTPTPHVQDYKVRNTPVGPKVVKDGDVRPATPDETTDAQNAPPGVSAQQPQIPQPQAGSAPETVIK